MNSNCTTRDQNFHAGECNTCHTSPRSVESHNILYQNEPVYIKMKAMDAWEGQKCTKNFFSEKRHDLSQLLIVVKRH